MTAQEYISSAQLWTDEARHFAVTLGGTREEAEDAVQEGLLTLWQHLPEVEASKGKAYLLGCTYRNMMNSFRRQRVQQAHADALRGAEAEEADQAFDLREATSRALNTLPPQQRDILRLRDIEGNSYKEIAETLEISVERVQVYLFRARVAMRKQMIAMGYGNDQ